MMTMLNKEQYFNGFTHSASDEKNAEVLISLANSLIAKIQSEGVVFKINPSTGSIISGKTFGGFRPKNCPQGAPASAHKTGMAVDLYDPDGNIDAWLLANAKELETYGLWFEHPDKTAGWSHWGIRKPASGRRFFYP